MQKSNFTVWVASLLAFVGGSIVLLFVCAVLSTAVAGREKSGRILVPTATSLPAPTATERLVESIPYYIMMDYTEDYIGDYVRIQGVITNAIKDQEDYLMLVRMENRLDSGPHTIMAVCMECPKPSIGSRTQFVGILVGRDTYGGVTMPLLWVTK